MSDKIDINDPEEKPIDVEVYEFTMPGNAKTFEVCLWSDTDDRCERGATNYHFRFTGGETLVHVGPGTIVTVRKEQRYKNPVKVALQRARRAAEEKKNGQT